jgi:glutaconate CoA-transferase subunit B
MNHEKRRFVPRVQFVTSPGDGEGGEWRNEQKLTGGGPSRLITSMGIFSFEPTTGEVLLSSIHPGVSVNEVQQNTGWQLKISNELSETIPPSADEIGLVRKYDPKRVWTS